MQPCQVDLQQPATEARPASPGHRFLASGNQWACLPLDLRDGLDRLVRETGADFTLLTPGPCLLV